MSKQKMKQLALIFFLVTILHNKPSKAQPPTVNPYAALHITPNPDGSITRIKEFFPTVPPNTTTSLAFSKDVPLNPNNKTWVRLYLPSGPPGYLNNLPVVVFAHGGGFILLSTAGPDIDLFLSSTASKLRVLVVSVEYRLAPEHRLPAAYDDVLEALYWVKDKKDEWVKNYGNVSRCIMMGESVGGNIVYNVGLRASVMTPALKPLVIRGLVLIQPFFGGADLDRGYTNPNMQVIANLLWNLSLPLGENRNNPYFNPIFGGGSSNLDKIRGLGWRVAFAGCDGDFIFDRQVKVFEFFKKRGLDVVSHFGKGYNHGVFIGNPSESQTLFEFVRNVFSPYLVS
ncbi:probable carboxylesterase 120 [Spinacia oleracea]|uniref:Probable carboxylesterase 120 n=1 Tax=Spinacia oleracea TaxID=3562 RepID=A0A9R0JPD6_SPIOL|nr:probable carboxylesterase 120 [Spinacia oleracea]